MSVNMVYITTNIYVLGARLLGGRRWRSWLKHCATSWKVAVSIPAGVIKIFH